MLSLPTWTLPRELLKISPNLTWAASSMDTTCCFAFPLYSAFSPLFLLAISFSSPFIRTLVISSRLLYSSNNPVEVEPFSRSLQSPWICPCIVFERSCGKYSCIWVCVAQSGFVMLLCKKGPGRRWDFQSWAIQTRAADARFLCEADLSLMVSFSFPKIQGPWFWHSSDCLPMCDLISLLNLNLLLYHGIKIKMQSFWLGYTQCQVKM